ncbi:MAG: hypothetical protein LH474_07510 [Chamaesiphon sp.]|nr:hypothetical protein [Chamaesiphon sp.]
MKKTPVTDEQFDDFVCFKQQISREQRRTTRPAKLGIAVPTICHANPTALKPFTYYTYHLSDPI